MAKKWQSLLQEKVNTDPTWPFDASLEFYDVQSDITLTTNMLTWRFGNSTAGLMPPVTAIYAPETNGMLFSSLFLIVFRFFPVFQSYFHPTLHSCLSFLCMIVFFSPCHNLNSILPFIHFILFFRGR